MLTAMAIALLIAVTIWWLLVQRLRDKPWARQGVVPTSQDDATSSAPHVGLWVFLAVVTSLFGLFASAYVMRMHDAHGELVQWQPLTEPRLLWVNTVLLVLASAALQIARGRAHAADLPGLRRYFTAGGILTIAFLGGQIWAWQLLGATNEYGAAHPAFAFFVLITAIHGLHMVGGLFVLGRTASRVWRGFDPAHSVTMGRVATSVELCTTYWHWLLLIWLGIFALLLTT